VKTQVLGEETGFRTQKGSKRCASSREEGSTDLKNETDFSYGDEPILAEGWPIERESGGVNSGGPRRKKQGQSGRDQCWVTVRDVAREEWRQNNADRPTTPHVTGGTSGLKKKKGKRTNGMPHWSKGKRDKDEAPVRGTGQKVPPPEKQRGRKKSSSKILLSLWSLCLQNGECARKTTVQRNHHNTEDRAFNPRDHKKKNKGNG